MRRPCRAGGAAGGTDIPPDHPTVGGAGAWAPLRHPPFRALWIAAVVVNLSLWMQNIGAAWMMTELRPESPLMVALVQTAMALPAFLLGLPSGVLADLVDRRRFLLATQSCSFGLAALLAGFSLLGGLDAWLLLGLTFALGCSSAFGMAAWIASNIDSAPQGQVPAAIALSTVTPNIARVVGPGLAGALIVLAGAPILFAVVAIGLFAGLVLLRALPRAGAPPALPPERMWNGIRSGLRYMRHSAQLYQALRLVFVFVTAGSAIWALLPLVARDQLGLGAGGFGLLLGSLGVGAVVSALQVTRLYRHFPVRAIVTGGSLLFMAVTALIPFISGTVAMCALLTLGGVAWMAVNTTTGTVIQTSAAAWVRARVASVYLLVIMGAMAAGGVLWGAIAERAGVAASLWIAAASIAAGLLFTVRVPMRVGSETDFNPAETETHWPSAARIDHDDGPVAVEIAYRVPTERHGEFVRTARELGLARKRNGAIAWRLYKDLENTDQFAERFLVASWLDYLRQRNRVTRHDHNLEQQLESLTVEGKSRTRRYIAEA